MIEWRTVRSSQELQLKDRKQCFSKILAAKGKQWGQFHILLLARRTEGPTTHFLLTAAKTFPPIPPLPHQRGTLKAGRRGNTCQWIKELSFKNICPEFCWCSTTTSGLTCVSWLPFFGWACASAAVRGKVWSTTSSLETNGFPLLKITIYCPHIALAYMPTGQIQKCPREQDKPGISLGTLLNNASAPLALSQLYQLYMTHRPTQGNILGDFVL